MGGLPGSGPRLGPLGLGLSVLGALSIGCGGGLSRDLAPAAEAEPRPAERRAPGVAVDPMIELPPPSATAEPTSGLAVLSTPIDPEPARRVVRGFFEAVVAESMPELEHLVDAGAHSRQGSKSARPEPALPWWRRRFDRLDYTALGADVFYGRSQMEAHTARDASTPGSRPLPVVARGDEVVVVVPLLGPQAQKLFGPELTFLLRKTPDQGPDHAPEAAAEGGRAPPPEAGGARPARYKIAELYEEFRLP